MMTVKSSLGVTVLALAFACGCTESSPNSKSVTPTQPDPDTGSDTSKADDALSLTDVNTDAPGSTDTAVTDAGSDASVAQFAGGGCEVQANGRAPRNANRTAPANSCADWTWKRQPFFGDLHVHTSWSFDAYGLGNKGSDPTDAYAFAKGAPVPIPPFDEDTGLSTRGRRTIDRALDFAAVTDHSEFIGEVALCTDPTSSAYLTMGCRNFRNSNAVEEANGQDVSFAVWGGGIAAQQRPAFCGNDDVDCIQASVDAWGELKSINDAAYDPCEFSAINAYEYTGMVGGSMNHRNVIFRNDILPERPVSAIDAANWEELATSLKTKCNDAGTGCNALAIPHNSNLSNGVLFVPTDGDGQPFDAQSACLRAEMEPLVEVVQVKSESECRAGFTNYPGTPDEMFCDFEKTDDNMPICAPGVLPCGANQDPATDNCEICLEECLPGEEGGDCVAPQDYARNVLKIGLEHQATLQANPYQLGFIGSTDTHNATPGRTKEATYEGHHGRQDDEPTDVLVGDAQNAAVIGPAPGFNPGGLAVVWAEENTRESIYDALRRRETYATSGTRPIVRVFAGANIPDDICSRQDFVATGYTTGVPMGGELTESGPFKFAVKALQDPAGAPLQQIHLVKVWIDANGNPQESVTDITPGARDYSASVDVNTCQISGPGQSELCTVYTDNHPSDQLATWYVRVIENPTCRWLQHQCLEQNVDCATETELTRCCDPNIPKVHQERAWTSPIYYLPAPE